MAKKSDKPHVIESKSDDGTDASIAGQSPESNGEIGGIPIANPTNATGASGGTDDNTASAKRGRGRPPGSAGKSSKQKAAPVSIKGIEQLLYTIHLGLVKATGISELELDREESKLLADAVAEVQQHYNVIIDPKTMAWLGLIGVCGTVYGPRVAAYKMRKELERMNNPQAPTKQDVKNSAQVVNATELTSVPVYHQ